jgi:DNA-binding IclR family transcriptional regulator
VLPDDRQANSPQSVTRVIHILEALCASATPVSLAELSRTLDTPKSSLAALLRGLTVAGFVLAADGAYRLGPGAFGLGSALLEARRRLQSSDLVREGMRRLADRSGETILFAVLDHDGQSITYVDMVESRYPVRFAVSIGDRRPLYCTSGGRALLAAQSEDDVRRYLKQLKPEPLTTLTETNKRKLAEAIAEARLSGFAQTSDQTFEGVAGTASAIRDAAGRAIGALILAAPGSRLTDRLADWARLTLDEAGVISRSLGYRPPSG